MAETARESPYLSPMTKDFETSWHSCLHQKLASGQLAVIAEVVPPRGASLDGVRRAARGLRGWVDAASVTDGQNAEVRLASWAGCLALMQEGVEPVMQLQCRDRNRIALQADLLGAAAMGIPNLLLLTGDDPRVGDEPDARGVFELDSLQLVALARRLRDEGLLLSGRRLSRAPRWFIGAAENPKPSRLERLQRKAEAGAQFIQTQIVFDVPAFGRWLAQVRDLGLAERCYVIVSVALVRTQRSLAYLSALPGVDVPEAVVRRLGGVPEGRREAEALALCAETIAQLREIEGVAGINVIAAGPEGVVPQLLTQAGVAPQGSATRDSRPSRSGG